MENCVKHHHAMWSKNQPRLQSVGVVLQSRQPKLATDCGLLFLPARGSPHLGLEGTVCQCA